MTWTDHVRLKSADGKIQADAIVRLKSGALTQFGEDAQSRDVALRLLEADIVAHGFSTQDVVEFKWPKT